MTSLSEIMRQEPARPPIWQWVDENQEFAGSPADIESIRRAVDDIGRNCRIVIDSNGRRHIEPGVRIPIIEDESPIVQFDLGGELDVDPIPCPPAPVNPNDLVDVSSIIAAWRDTCLGENGPLSNEVHNNDGFYDNGYGIVASMVNQLKKLGIKKTPAPIVGMIWSTVSENTDLNFPIDFDKTTLRYGDRILISGTRDVVAIEHKYPKKKIGRWVDLWA